ncbi:hypothetical protein ACQ9ZF_11295 (plasmid) [Cetobacterium somerae]|uniref:hypothetical protein n=1 Tax=Cetobacterium somerae TaxID=188913 RepID=UPI003D767E40
MKKVLFGIMALSMAVFAANPGDLSEDKSSGTASVPVRVIAEVVKPANALIITDEAGTILDELLLDHKVVAGTNTSDSVVAKSFKVKVTTAAGAVDGTNNGNVTIALDKTTTTLTKVGTDQGVSDENTITSNLRLVNGPGTTTTAQDTTTYKYEATLNGGEHLGTITSTIAAGSVPTAAGAYDNKATGTPMPTLSVTYSASGTVTK